MDKHWAWQGGLPLGWQLSALANVKGKPAAMACYSCVLIITSQPESPEGTLKYLLKTKI